MWRKLHCQWKLTTPDIESWPGNGNVANGELANTGSFFDANNDGTYNHEDGDYPYFKLDGDYPTDPNTGETVVMITSSVIESYLVGI
jgi:hypothetical protein